MCDICHKNPHDSRCPNAPEPQYPTCPHCGKQAEVFYCNSNDEPEHCEYCLPYRREWWQIGGNDNGEI